VASVLALLAAFLFALAATLQQKGALNLSEVSLRHPSSLARLAGERMWLLGTVVLLLGYLVQARALDIGRLVVVQPLLVTTIVFALPLGWWLTGQHVGQREILGAGVIVFGLVLFVLFGDPAGGVDNAPNDEWAIAIAVVAALCTTSVVIGSRGTSSTKAAGYGAAAGILFGLSASLTKPTVEVLHMSVEDVLSSWEFYALMFAGGLGFVLQQVSLGTGRLAPSVATVSVANPVVSILIGVFLFEERLTRPAWHVVVALTGLGLALVGAVVISMAGEAGEGARREPDAARSSDSSAAIVN
jgi:drug/metabolite transporter (DMT)-like permease